MLSFEEAGRVLDAAVEQLPEGIFVDLNGGVNLLPEEKKGEDGRFVLGLYHRNSMGRYVEIFYGSFLRVFPEATDEEFAAELEKTLRHELTHHVENKAGDRTLERWDEEQAELWREGEPLTARSVLFADGDGRLSQQADALFQDAMGAYDLEIRSGWCAVSEATAELLERYEAVLCMTMDQAEELAARFPAADEKILCLGEKDILPDRHGTARTLRREIGFLAEELAMGGEAP